MQEMQQLRSITEDIRRLKINEDENLSSDEESVNSDSHSDSKRVRWKRGIPQETPGI